MTKTKSICLFCGSRDGNSPTYTDLASRFGAELARQNIRLVYGGGGIGLMGAAAKACIHEGGEVLGIIPEFLCTREIAFDGCELEVVQTLHQRKARMADQSDGFVVLPGGLGTLEELVEVLSWINLKELKQKIVLLDEDGYWQSFIDLLSHTVSSGFTDPEVMGQTLRAHSIEDAILKLQL